MAYMQRSSWVDSGKHFLINSEGLGSFFFTEKRHHPKLSKSLTTKDHLARASAP